MMRRSFRVLLTLWAGSLWSTALWVTPVLFHEGDRHLAGVVAGRLFTIETYLGVAVALLALLLPGRARFVWGYLAAALLIVNQWVLRSLMNAAHAHGAVMGLTFGAWHGVSALIYVVACLAVLWSVWNEDFR